MKNSNFKFFFTLYKPILYNFPLTSPLTPTTAPSPPLTPPNPNQYMPWAVVGGDPHAWVTFNTHDRHPPPLTPPNPNQYMPWAVVGGDPHARVLTVGGHEYEVKDDGGETWHVLVGVGGYWRWGGTSMR